MPASDSSTSHMAPLAELPDVADHSVGDMVNVKGALYVLTAAPRTSEFQGTAGSTRDGYLGTIVVGNERVGSFIDPEAKGEVTWIASQPTADSRKRIVRLRIVRATFAANEGQPETLSVWIVAQLGPATHVTLTRDSERDNTTVYAWAIKTGDTINIKAGQNFTVVVEGGTWTRRARSGSAGWARNCRRSTPAP